jgi:ABC-type Zn uptake system ZnuABC Zn-binding protein ZnuA
MTKKVSKIKEIKSPPLLITNGKYFKDWLSQMIETKVKIVKNIGTIKLLAI